MTPLLLLAWAIIVVQGGHVLEHVAQTAQVFVFGVARPHAHGLLGAVFDLEWVHLVYNTLFLAGLAWAFQRHGAGLRRQARGFRWSMFVAGLTLQVYHEVEHVVKIVQHVGFGLTPAPGLLGNLVDLVVLHLAFNLVVYLLVLPMLRSAARSPDPTPGLTARTPRGSGAEDRV